MNTVKKLRPDRFLYTVWLATSVLWGGATIQPPPSRAEERMLRVVSSPAGLTVEARGVGMEEVLREIGKQLGFTVTAKKVVYPTVEVSIKDAPPEEVLQQVLRGENYALVYRTVEGKSKPKNGEIDKVLLLSPSSTVTVNSVAESGRLGQGGHPAFIQSQVSATSLPETAQAARVFRQEGWVHLTEKADAIAHSGPVTVNDILGGQAFQALQAMNAMEASSNSERPFAEEGPETAEAEPANEVLTLANMGADEQRRVQESLARAAQLAQRNLTVLVEGLAAATNSLPNVQPTQGPGDR